MDLRHLRYLVAAVQEGSLRAAAERMNVAQPALSRRIRDLEGWVGCSLLRRNIQGVEPTAAGAVFYQEVVDVLQHLNQAVEKARFAAAGEEGVVRLGLPQNSRRYTFVQESISAFGAAKTQSSVTFMRAASTKLEAELLENRLDIALIYDWFYGHRRLRERPLAATQGLEEKLVHRERYMLAMHPRHPLAAPGKATLKDLAGVPMLWPNRNDNPEYFDSLVDAFALEGVEPQVAHTASNFDEMVDLAISSGGVFLAAASTRLSTPPDALVYRPLPGLKSELHLKLVWRSRPSKSAQALLNIIQDEIARYQRDLLGDPAGWFFLQGEKMVTLPE